MNFEELNFLAILLAAVGKFIVGGMWFSKILFGALWLQETGLKMDVEEPRVHLRELEGEEIPSVEINPFASGNHYGYEMPCHRQYSLVRPEVT